MATRRRRPGARSPRVAGRLPVFSRALGVDVIITEAGQPFLIELQHGFGRRGLIELFPLAHRAYRKIYWPLRRQGPGDSFIVDEMRRISGDKISTYGHFHRYQPPSFVYTRWGADVEGWLAGLESRATCVIDGPPSDAPGSRLVLAKPPRGSCGVGIEVLDRAEVRAWAAARRSGEAVLLQAFVESRRLLDGDGRPHLGCIRHVVLMHSDGCSLGFIHLPSYWRVAPQPLADQADREALTANISRGAYPLPVSATDSPLVHRLAEEVTGELVRLICELSAVPRGTSVALGERGEWPGAPDGDARG